MPSARATNDESENVGNGTLFLFAVAYSAIDCFCKGNETKVKAFGINGETPSGVSPYLCAHNLIILTLVLTKTQFIMRIFTKMLLTASLMAGWSQLAQAEKVYADLSKYTDNWSENVLRFTWTAPWGNQLQPELNVASGANVFATDLSGWQKLVVETSAINNADFYRILVYNPKTDNSDYSDALIVNQTGKMEFDLASKVFDLTKVTKIVLSGSNGSDSHFVNNALNPAGEFKITAIYLERPDDPLAIPKDALSKVIATASKLNLSVEGTPLADAISAAETAKTNATTAEALTSAKSTLEQAFANAGFTLLTVDMFKKWNDDNASATSEPTTAGGSHFGETLGGNGVIYGFNSGNVYWHSYADVSSYEKLVVVGEAGKEARFLFNRQKNAENLEAEGGSFVEKRFALNENGLGEVIVSEVGDFAHINTVKAPGGGTFAGIYAYKTPQAAPDPVKPSDPVNVDPLVSDSDPAVAANKAALLTALNKAYRVDVNKFTMASVIKMNKAIKAGETQIRATENSIAALEAAKHNILQCIDELEEVPARGNGIYDLTKEMFAKWSGIDAKARAIEAVGCDLNLGSVGAGSMVYGNSSVQFETYANLAEFDKLIIVGSEGVQLRVLMNRLEVGNGGGDGNGGALTELNPTIGADGMAVIDLKDESKFETVAHLNAIKTGWGSAAGTITKLLLVKGDVDYSTVGINSAKAAAEGGVCYDLQGRRVAAPAKGLYIVNGKKVLVK